MGISKRTLPIYLSLMFASIYTAFPLYWLFSSALKSLPEYLQVPPLIFPLHPTLENFAQVLFAENLTIYFWNSAYIASVSTIISVMLGSLSGYGFSRFKFPLSNYLFLFILVTRMIPFTSLVIPFFLLMRNYGLLDTHIAVILAHLTFQLPYAVWMMASFFQEMPQEYEEAAWLDGCSRIGVLFRIVIPIASPAMIATSIFCFIWSWNEFVFAVTLTQSTLSKTLPVRIYEWITPYYSLWGPMFASGVLASLPVLLLSLALQKYFAKGLLLGTRYR